jgi:hypothetical protein
VLYDSVRHREHMRKHVTEFCDLLDEVLLYMTDDSITAISIMKLW